MEKEGKEKEGKRKVKGRRRDPEDCLNSEAPVGDMTQTGMGQ